MATKEQRQRSCLVCSTIFAGHAHFGMDACRACAAFYKRSIRARKRYVCRTGKMQCDLARDTTSSCRRCRMDRCTELGMKLIKTPSPALPSPSDPSSTLLGHFARSYGKYCLERQENEELLRMTSVYRDHPVAVPGTSELKYLATIEFEGDNTAQANVSMLKFLRRAFPQFLELTNVEQQMVFGQCSSPLWIVECFKNSEEFMPGNDRYFTSGMTTIHDVENRQYYLPEKERAKLEDLMIGFEHYWERLRSLIRPSMRRAQLNEREYHALMILLIWTTSSRPDCRLTPTIAAAGESIRRRLFAELNDYYRMEMNREDYATRIGEIGTLAHALEESSVVMQEELRVCNLYELFKPDSYVARGIALI